MKLRTLLIIVGVLALAEGAVWWREAHVSRDAGSAFVDRSLLELSDIERARRIVIREKPQSKTIEKNRDGFEVRLIVEQDAPIRETVLERRAGDQWVVANRFDLDADASWLGQTLRDLTQGRLVRHVASEPELMNDLGLELGQVRLEDENGRVLRRLDFGRKDGGEVYQFVRVNEREAFVAKHETEIVGDPLTWVAGRVFQFEVAEVREVELPFTDAPESSIVLKRATAGAPLLPSESEGPASTELSRQAEAILAKLIAEPVILALDPKAPAAVAARQNFAARVRVVLFNGRRYTIHYGVVPKGDPSAATLAPNNEETVAFGFFECSDAQDLAQRQSTKAALGYNRAGTLGRLPESRAALAGNSPDAREPAPTR